MTPRLLLAGLATGLFLCACTDPEPEPKIADSPPPPASSTLTTPTPSTPLPSTASSPEDAVKAWVAARNSAMADGDTTELRLLTDPTCDSCLGLITGIEEVYAAGGRYETAGWQITSAELRKSASRPTVDAALVLAGGQTTEAAGADPVEYAPENRLAVFKLRMTDSDWLVDFIGFVS